MDKPLIAPEMAVSQPVASVSALHEEAMTSPVTARDGHGRPTDFSFPDGRTRHVIYNQDGAVNKVEDGGNIGHKNGLNAVGEWDRLPNGKYLGVGEKPLQPSWFPQADALNVKEDGGIVLHMRDKGNDYSAVLEPDGSDHLQIVDTAHLGKEQEFWIAPDGSGRKDIKFRDGSKAELEFIGSALDLSDPRSIKFESNGGTLAWHMGDHGGTWEAHDPAGNTSSGALSAADFQSVIGTMDRHNHVSIEWFKADNKGVHYDLLNDDVHMFEILNNGLHHAQDYFSK